MQKRSIKDYAVISLKGMAMGAADIVPGVSGGTIALISGIYEELLTSISNVKFSLFSVLKKDGIKQVWNQVNGNFLLALALGIGISILSFAKGLSWLLANEPVLLWSFFFGLVLASVFFIGKQIGKWNFLTVLMFVSGSILAYWITTLEPMISGSTSSVYFFIAGSLAICAMILPGISGAFILVLLGAYKPVLEAVHSRDTKIILIVVAGAIVGLLSFSKVLKWLFSNYKDFIMAVLTGFVFGSLNKIWPWKKVLNSKMIEEKLIILKEQSISPFQFEGENQLTMAIVISIVGFVSILILERIAIKNE